MIRVFIGLLAFLFCFEAFGQKPSYTSDEETVAGRTLKGQSTFINLDKKSIDRIWLKKLKELGKPEAIQGDYQIKIAVVPFSSTSLQIYSKLTSTNGGTRIFWSLDNGEQAFDEKSSYWTSAGQFLVAFGIDCYRQDLNNQIAEADKSVESAVKLHDARQKNREVLLRDIERNRTEKLRLEKQLVENAQQLLKFKADSSQNKAEIDGSLAEIDRLRKIAEDKKNKLKDFN